MRPFPIAEPRAAARGATSGALFPAFLLVLTAWYLATYFAQGALPGNSLRHPEGWWGWWDQGMFLRSARALAAGNLRPEEHWYPMGYALLGAPFARVWPAHPFVLANLASLLATAWFFVRFAGSVGVGRGTAMLLFLGAGVLDPLIFKHWVIPWNTSPVTALTWALLWAAAEHANGRRRPALMGALTVLIGWLRPSDLLVPAIVVGTVFAHALWSVLRTGAGQRRAAVRAVGRDALLLGGGAAVPALAALGLHLLIYGPRPSPYMGVSRDLGFSLHAYGWKAYYLLMEPRAWWGEGTGLMQRHPWLALSALGLPFALFTAGPAMVALSLAAAAHTALYLSYVDLLPTGFWRFNNVHYFTWILLALVLVAWVGLREMRRARWPVAAAVAVPVLLLLAARLDPVPARPGVPVRALMLPDASQGFTETYFGEEHAVRDAAGEARNIRDVRFVPVPGGTRVLALRRDLQPPVDAVAFPGVTAVQALEVRPRLGWFCWLPPYACKKPG